MATLRQIKEKQTSVKTINKITKAMQLVASAKSQKAIKDLNDYSEFYLKVKKIINKINKENIIKEDKFNGNYWILIMSDLGLAGGYNNNLLQELKKQKGPNDKFIILGNKGAFYTKLNKDIGEWFSLDGLVEHGNLLMELTTRIKTEYYDNNLKVKIIYAKYVSQIEFKPTIKTILPMESFKLDEEEVEGELIEFEPNKEKLIKEFQSLYINSIIVNMYKEAQASEHMSRKNAMETASQNGKELLEKLSIEYNRGRQSKITQEISEIIGGAESLK